MARRLKDPSPYLNQVTGAEVEVVSQDYNLFYKPDVKPMNKAVDSLIASLSNIVPSLASYSVTEEVKTKAVDEAKAVEDFETNKVQFNQLIKDGKIPEGASPFYYNKMMELDLQNKARLFKKKFDTYYAENSLEDSLNPDAFTEAYEEQLKAFYKEQGLDKYDPLALNNAFFKTTSAFRNERYQQHSGKIMANIKGQTEKNFIMNTAGTIIDGQNDGKTALEVLKDVKGLTDGLISVGTNKHRANNLFLSSFKKYIETVNDEEGFLFAGEMLEELKTFKLGTGSFGGSAQGSAYIAELEMEIATKELKNIKRNNDVTKVRRENNQEKLYIEYFKAKDTNPEFDSFDFINQRKQMTNDFSEGGYLFNSEERIYLQGLENTIKKTESTTNDDLEALKLLQETLSTNPLEVRNLAQELADEGKITFNTYKAFWKSAGTYDVIKNNDIITQTKYSEYLPLFKDKFLTSTGELGAELPLMQIKYQERVWNKYLELKETLKGETLRKQMDVELKGILAEILRDSVLIQNAPEIYVPIFMEYGIAIVPDVT
uniref:Uncharacterized protein n=1 Tax=uncultured Alphaproteobacteria bacterium TaxID=91750 RepID=A0A1B0Z1I9_9PROT|nr:hypothetical protein [uncultured Alphaproteobacteria bacterium]